MTRSTATKITLFLLFTVLAPTAHAQVGRQRQTQKDPRYVRLKTLAEGQEHPVVGWFADTIYVVRPEQPAPGRKAELDIRRTEKPNVFSVRRRVIGTTTTLKGTARLVQGRRWVQLQVTYTTGQGMIGGLAGPAKGSLSSREQKPYGTTYDIRAKGNAILGETTLPSQEEAFDEKGVALNVAYRRATSLISHFTERTEEEKAELEKLRAEPVVVNCWVSEFSADARDITVIRFAKLRGVEFRYDYPEELGWHINEKDPQHIFVIAHGWMNDSAGSQGFASQMIRGILARAERDGLGAKDLAFVFISWNSKRTIFMESAMNAETIGHRGVAPLVKHLQKEVPGASVTLIGHSLGGRMMLSSLQGPKKEQSWAHKKRVALFRSIPLSNTTLGRSLIMALRGRSEKPCSVDAVVLLEAAADVDSLHKPVGQLNYGDFPNATEQVRFLVNAHSRNDDILRVAYTASNGVVNLWTTIKRYWNAGDGVQALGRLGAQRGDSQGVQLYPGLTITGEQVDPKALDKAFGQLHASAPNAPGNKVVNADVTALLPKAETPKPGGGEWSTTESHTEIFQPAIFDLIWQVTRRAAKR